MFKLVKEINTMLDNHEEDTEMFYWTMALLKKKTEFSRFCLCYSKAKKHYYLVER